MQTFLELPDRAILIGLGGVHDYWTVVKSISPKQIKLIDSDGLKQLNRKSCTTGEPSIQRRHQIHPTHTYFLCRYVPFVEKENEIFLKTVFPTRKYAKLYDLQEEKWLEMNKKAFEPIDEEERELMESIENNEWRSVKNFKEEKEKAELAARNTLKKDKRINLRLPQKDYHQIQVKAIEEGIPYQTLISSIIHKYLNGTLTPKSSEQNKGIN